MRRNNKNVWPEECQHKGREVYGAPSCRYCEFNEFPELADGGCILSNDPAFKEFMHRRREHILELFDVSLSGMNATQRRDRARARGNIKRMLKRCTDFDTLQMLEDQSKEDKNMNDIKRVFELYVKDNNGETYIKDRTKITAKTVMLSPYTDAMTEFLNSLEGGEILSGSGPDEFAFITLNVLLPDSRIVAATFEGCVDAVQVEYTDLTDAVNKWWNDRDGGNGEEVDNV